ncbi:MAG: tetratricopeptide repeat protein [Blastocatellia bacterium]
MRLNASALCGVFAAILCLPIVCFSQGQAGGAPPSIQFFMPDGSLPPRELRFIMIADNGRVETFFTDSKGRFLITRQLGLKTDAEYRITVQSDGSTFDTTSVSFKEFGVYYIPVFLRPIKSPKTKPAGLVDIAELDALAPEEARQAYANAMRSLKAGEGDKAVRELEHAVAIYPNYFRALNDLGVLYMKSEQLDMAARAFERAIKIGPRVYYPRLNLAVINTRRAKYQEAVTQLEQLHKDNPTLPEVRVALGDALMAMNRLDEAETHLRAALADAKLDRGATGDAHYKLGMLLNRKQRYAEAIRELTQAEEALPYSARTHLQLGGALLQVGKLDEAERELLLAYRLDGKQMGGAQLMLGQIYFMEKKYDVALRAFEQYLADVPHAPNSAEIGGVIKKIKVALNKD